MFHPPTVVSLVLEDVHVPAMMCRLHCILASRLVFCMSSRLDGIFASVDKDDERSNNSPRRETTTTTTARLRSNEPTGLCLSVTRFSHFVSRDTFIQLDCLHRCGVGGDLQKVVVVVREGQKS